MKKNVLKTMTKLVLCMVFVLGVVINPIEAYSEAYNEYYHYVEWDPEGIYKDKVVEVKVPFNAEGNMRERITITIKYKDTNEVIDVIDINGKKK